MKQCRFCGGNDLKPWTGQYERCNDCLYICTVPPPSPDEIDRHYSQYHENNHQKSEAKNSARAISYVQEIRWLESRLGSPLPGPVFDYGASGGYFLDALVSEGGVPAQTAYGDDLSPGAVEQLTRKGYRKKMPSLEPGSMKLVTLRGVLEHLLDFRAVVESLTELVAEDGAFFITATPDASSTVANLYRDRWVQHHYPSHFQHFTSALVDRLLAERGFVLVDHIDLYRESVYRSTDDDQRWLRAVHGFNPGTPHAYWGSMMTRLYRRGPQLS
jgi:hypothetical protein